MKRQLAIATRLLLCAAIVVPCFVGVVVAAPPVLQNIEPRGARRGETVRLTLRGNNLEGAQLFGDLPGVVAIVDSKPGSLTAKIQSLPTAPVGLYPIRARTDGGLSGALLFSLGDLPEALEQESNDRLESASPIPLPGTVNGTISGTDRDFFGFAAKKGQRLTLEVEAARLDSKLDPLIRVLDARGLELAHNDDAGGLGPDSRLSVEIPDDGTYYAVVHDAKYSGAAPGFYRLKIGAFDFAEGIFPLGWRRGQPVQVALVGGTLAGPCSGVVDTAVPDWLGWRTVSLPLPGPQATLPHRFVVGDDPEVLEPDSDTKPKLMPETVVNGRIAEPGEVDRFAFKVKPGQTWLFDLDAASLGSPLDAVLSVHDADGKRLAMADDTGQPDPQVTFKVPSGIEEVVLAVSDLLERGGPAFAYRLCARRPKPDFALEITSPVVNIPRGGTALARVRVRRSGYNGPVQLSIPEDLAGIRAEGGLIPAGQNEGLLVLSAGGGAPLRVLDLPVFGQGGPAAKPMRREAHGGALGNVALATRAQMDVPAAICGRLPVSLKADAQKITLLQGHSTKVKITAGRDDEATEPIEIRATQLPERVSGGSATVAQDASEAIVAFSAQKDAPLRSTTVLLEGKTKAGTQEELIQLPPMEVEVVRPFSLEVVAQPIAVSAGSKTKIVAVVRRVPPFRGAVKVEPSEGLPTGIGCTTIQLTEADSLVELELEAAESVKPGDYAINLRGTTLLGDPAKPEYYSAGNTRVSVKVVPSEKKEQQQEKEKAEPKEEAPEEAKEGT